MKVAFPIAITAVALSVSTALMANENIEETVVVTATRTEIALDSAPASMSVITAEEIENNPSITIADIISEATSVEANMDSTRAGKKFISIRGMESKYTLIMVNGRRMSSASAIVRANDFDLSTIPMDSIERIEIIRGPMSALYGSDGMGGTINIITKMPSNDWSTNLNIDLASPFDSNGGEESVLGFSTAGALIEDTLFARLSVNQSSREAWKPFSGIKPGTDINRGDITALEERDSLSLFGTLSWHANDNHMLDLDLGYSDDQRDSVAENALNITEGETRVERNSFALSHIGFWNWGESLARVSREEVNNRESTDLGDDIKEVVQIAEVSATTYLGDDHTLTVGVDYQASELSNPEHIVGTKAEAYQWAAFAQDQWTITENTTATMGVRYDSHEHYGDEVSPRLYLVHQATNNLTVKGGVGRAFRAPTMVQYHPDFAMTSCKGACTIIGKPDLEAETNTSYEIGAIYSEYNWRVEGTLFRNEISNLIQNTDPWCEVEGAVYNPADQKCYMDGDFNSQPTPSDVWRTYENVEEALVQGLELSAQVNLSEQFRLSGNYTYLDTEDKATGLELEGRSRHSTFAKLDWFPTQDWSTFVSANYRSKEVIGFTGDDAEYREGYTLFNLGANYQLNEMLRFRAGIKNITDEAIEDELSQSGYVIEPRTFYVGMSASF